MTTYEALRAGVAYIDVSTRGKLKLTGEDRARLLHAMSSNDVNHLEPQQALYAFFLSAQGRILADAEIYNLGDSIWLDTEPQLGPKLRDHLDKYIIADDVSIDDETDPYAAIELNGPGFLAAAARLELPVPESKTKLTSWRGGFIARVSSTASDGLRIFLPVAQKPELLQRLDSHNIPAATPEDAELVRIENGIPRYGHDIGERYLVQETGLLDAVHTNKGCYLGQEIVERVRSRGQVHRHLSRIRIAGSTAPAPGTKLTGEGKDLGEITSAIYSPALGEVAALAYLRTEAVATRPELHAGELPARLA